MAAVVIGEQALVGGLVLIVELLGKPLAQLLHYGGGVEAGKQHREGSEHHAGRTQVRRDGLSHAGILDLDRTGPAIGSDGPVDLADGSCRDGHRIPVLEKLVRWSAQLGS